MVSPMLQRNAVSIRFIFLLIVFWLPSSASSGQIFKFPPPDTLSGSFFGGSVAVDSQTAVVGSTGYNSCGPNSGAAFVYERRDDSTWSLAATLEPSDCRENHFFGKSVAISQDRILVSSFRSSFNQMVSNGVYLFERTERGWTQKVRISDPDKGAFGTFASALSMDGDRFIVTAAGGGDGTASRGAGYIYELQETGKWTMTARLTAESRRFNGVFGTSCALDGNRIAISSSSYSPGQPGRVSIFDLDPESGEWKTAHSVDNVQSFFMPIDLSGNQLLVGESKAGRSESGRARLFEFDGKAWNESMTFRPETPYNQGAFGTLVTISGDFVLIVGFDEQLELSFNVDRVVYVYQKTATSWRQRTILDVGNPFFGTSLAMSGPNAIIGQSSEGRPGHAYAITFNLP